jgi:hypothetical protein
VFGALSRLAGAALVAVAFVALIIFGGYKAGWWLTADSQQRRVELNHDTYGVQADQTQIAQDVTTINQITVQISTADPGTAAALRAQRRAVLGQLCSTYAGIGDPTRLDATTHQFADANCFAGAVSQSSQYAS